MSRLSSPSLPEQWLGKHLLFVSKGKTLQTAVNFQAEHISAEKRDCVPIAGGSRALGRL